MIVEPLKNLIQGITGLIFNLGLAFFVIVFLYFGIKYLIGKSEEETKSFQEKLPYLLLGISLIFLAFTLIGLVRKFFE